MPKPKYLLDTNGTPIDDFDLFDSGRFFSEYHEQPEIIRDIPGCPIEIPEIPSIGGKTPSIGGKTPAALKTQNSKLKTSAKR